MIFQTLFLFAVASGGFSGCVPARWDSAEPKSLELLRGTSVNCLLIEKGQWDAGFLEAAKGANLRLLAVVHSAEEAARAEALPVDALVVENDLSLPSTKKPVLRMPVRVRMNLTSPGEIAGTSQGLWPGIHVEKDGAVVAAPTGAPWIDTNAGFLRFLRSSVPKETAVWMANRPPNGEVLSGRRYVQAIGDAAMTGARWVVALDPALRDALLRGNGKALNDWKQITAALDFYETNREFWQWPDHSSLALLQDSNSGALYSGGFLDMMGARHIPASIVPTGKLMERDAEGVRLLLNIDPSSLSDAQKEKVRSVARGGAMVVNGPPGWKLSLAEGESITFTKEQVKQLDEAWKEINGLVGRRNFGVRVFGAPSMLSNLKASPDGKRLAIHLVNYSDYPVEAISLHLDGKFTRARLLTPQGERTSDVYPIEEGTGVDINKIVDVGIVIVE